ncbi:MAG: coproporphyrinogen-III oxidase family protein [Pirellulaceae bacterium]
MATDSTKTEVGSYFISNYPPFSQWSEEYLDQLHQALSSPPRPDVPLGLYLHIPFCRKRCKFCYFRVYTDKNSQDVEKYVTALVNEIHLVSETEAMGGRPFKFVYFGGGTPSFLSPKQLGRLEDRLRSSISWDQAEEVTFECEPGTLSESKVKALKAMGITRLSLGIENFHDSILEENGRAHLSKEVYTAWEWIEAADFPNVNVDLISGMVGETWETWRENIRKVLLLSPESVTIYQMELPFNTVYSQDILGNKIETPVADWPTKRAWLSYAMDELSAAGYKTSSAYTMVKDTGKINFSYRDNLFGGADLLATGVASFGHISGVHYQNKTEWADYTGEILEHNRLPLNRAYVPTQEQMLIRETALLLKRGYLERDYFQKKFNVDIYKKWDAVWKEYEQEGYLTRTDDRVELTREGLLRADSLLSAFFEEQFKGVRYT